MYGIGMIRNETQKRQYEDHNTPRGHYNGQGMHCGLSSAPDAFPICFKQTTIIFMQLYCNVLHMIYVLTSESVATGILRSPITPVLLFRWVVTAFTLITIIT